MKKMLIFTVIILSYHLLLFSIPLLIFLASIYWSSEALLNIIPWILGTLVLLSPFLAIFLGYHLIINSITPIGRLTPIIVNYIGYSPLLLLCFLLSSQWNPRDYLLFVSLPFLLGLLSNLATFISNSLRPVLIKVLSL
jgi:hypothetical protein